MPQRGRLAHILVSDQAVSDGQHRLAVEDLPFLIPEGDNISLPGEKSIGDHFPVQNCGEKISQ